MSFLDGTFSFEKEVKLEDEEEDVDGCVDVVLDTDVVFRCGQG